MKGITQEFGDSSSDTGAILDNARKDANDMISDGGTVGEQVLASIKPLSAPQILLNSLGVSALIFDILEELDCDDFILLEFIEPCYSKYVEEYGERLRVGGDLPQRSRSVLHTFSRISLATKFLSLKCLKAHSPFFKPGSYQIR